MYEVQVLKHNLSSTIKNNVYIDKSKFRRYCVSNK